MEIIVNGETRRLGGTSSVAELLAELGLADKRVAVERNGTIVPRSRHGDEALADGDRIEIVRAIGGG